MSSNHNPFTTVLTLGAIASVFTIAGAAAPGRPDCCEPPATGAATATISTTAIAPGDKVDLSMDTITRLLGTWVAVDAETGKPTDTVVSTFRPTAGGSAVLETLFPGTDNEMISMYHMDGHDLVMTHYCMLGNQPQLKARLGEGDNQLIFECRKCDAPATNIDASTDTHMHKGVVTFIGNDRLKSRWYPLVDGELGDPHQFEMVRQADRK